ncbi:MAG: septal ring lytic transglycosylase RlpA family protein [Wolbachia sp.]|nr:septal ring lytic transglycosylase RlpA family protein [Wolbachia sp.]MDD9335791.1 septal ring lytic transglycosylase RlpA family protein [Wolbachia sp.]
MSSCSSHDRYYNTAGSYSIGKSYTINDVTYHPKRHDHYEEIGVASWYGIEDHGTLTANGEVFDRHSISAAHRTLQLPCFVLVTNLKNGKKLVVRVNDRGPFFKNRIIDLSEEAARILGFHKDGITRVKVQYLKKMSEKLIKKNPHYRKQYEKVIQAHHHKKPAMESKGYITFFKDVNIAKSTASTLRSQGVKNVRLLFKDNRYCVKVG